MKVEISESEVEVEHNGNIYIFEKYKGKDKTLDPEDNEIPDEVVQELEDMNFFVRDYPKTFEWKLGAWEYDYDDILIDLPEGTIEEDSLAHKSLYNLLCDDYGALTIKIEVDEKGYCRIVDVENDLPVKGHVRRRNR